MKIDTSFRLNRRQFGANMAAVLAFANAPLAWAQSWPKGDLAKDIQILRQAYEAMHPGLYRYSAKAEVDARFDQLAKEFPKSKSLAEAFLTLSRFTATIKCGHTYASFFNMPIESARALFAGKDKIPVHFRWLNGRMIVTKDQTPDGAIRPGTEIVSINGVPPQTIFAALIPLVRADGGNDGKRRELLEVNGTQRIETFDAYYPLLYPVRDAKFVLDLVAPDGATRKLTVDALDLPQRRAGMKGGLEPNQDKLAPKNWSFRHDSGVTVLTMDDWVTYNTKWDWRGFLDAGFLEIAAKRPKGLIVDLRGNEGGEDCGNEILARLIDKDLSLEAYERRVRFRKAPEALWPYLDTWDNSFRTLGEGADDIGEGWFRLKGGEENGQTIKPKGPRYQGKVAVLIDSANSSATFQFLSTIKREGLGVLIGQPTGGNQRGINGGSFFFLQLPGSGLEAELPLVGTFPVTEKPDAGLSPNIPVEATAADIAAGRDPAMTAALAYINA